MVPNIFTGRLLGTTCHLSSPKPRCVAVDVATATTTATSTTSTTTSTTSTVAVDVLQGSSGDKGPCYTEKHLKTPSKPTGLPGRLGP